MIGAAATLLLGALGAPNATAYSGTGRVAGDVVSTTFYEAIDALTVADEDRTGYVHAAYRHWTDANGCNARKDVIISEAIDAPAVGPGCTLTGGVWFSPYDDVTVTDASGLDVDHLVPLAEN
ncbi:hypothetical protein ACIBJD_33770 [Kitasatospora sp. NPDC050467]|uniref:hypothetical protein n=1 Tax=Kitasatospora sp. NPDC050467 TaxID=3364053 RepID=UPI0037ACBE73